VKKKIKISFVQGRLSKQVGSNFQYFPIDNWQNEIREAKKIGLANIEWIISDFSNPIFNTIFVKSIINCLKKFNIKISSLSLDFLMKQPFYSLNINDLKWLIQKLNLISKKFGKLRINIPIEEESRVFNYQQMVKLEKNLEYFKKKISKIFLISIETDISPENVSNLLRKKKFRGIGINLDIGNIEANGYNIETYFEKLKNLIFGVHIKNRNILFSKSRMLKNKKNLNYIFKNLNSLNKLNDITLQTFKDNKNFKNQLIKNLKLVQLKFKNERV
jgi:sugar phosphate isomerase/epimerase